MNSQRVRQFFSGLIQFYSTTALILVNVFVLFVLLNAAFFVIFWVKDRLTGAVVPSDAEQFRAEMVKPLAYEPFTMFKERRRASKWVNVDEDGFRMVKDQGPWPPDPSGLNIFVFGGSTTFGYGVADGETWPSRLQELLSTRMNGVRVYNFGRGYYYSTQERILFEQLLVSGYVPRMAIFLDGINDFAFDKDDLAFSERFSNALEGQDRGQVRFGLLPWLSGLPIGRAVATAKRRLAKSSGPQALSIDSRTKNAVYNDAEVIQHIIDRYLQNKKIIESSSHAYDVIPVFVWQPTPTYKYDLQYHRFAADGFGVHNRARYGYATFANMIRDRHLEGNFLWLADIQERSRESLYIDLIHYSPEFLKKLATQIDRRLMEQDLYDQVLRPRYDSTGPRR